MLKCIPAVTSRLIKQDPTFHHFTWKDLLIYDPIMYASLIAYSTHFYATD